MPNCAGAPTEAGASLGGVAAGISIPALPDRCREHVAETADIAKPGDDAFSLLRRADQRIRDGNRRVDDCAAFFDGLAAGLTRKPAAPDVPD